MEPRVTLRRGPYRWNTRYDGDYFNEPAQEAGFRRTLSMPSPPSIPREKRAVFRRRATWAGYGNDAIKSAIDGEAGYITMVGDAPAKILRWDGKVATQPFGVRTVHFPGYQPGFGGIAISRRPSARHRGSCQSRHRLLRRTRQPGFHAAGARALAGLRQRRAGRIQRSLRYRSGSWGQYYVADYGNNRVQIFDSTGQFKGFLDEGFRFEGPHASDLAMITCA